ncbi:AIPR family protein [Rhodococcus fascians]|nr:AIPR family protein [Rhodococcus fascians]MBY4398812.1 AIPR family protein [Rhodococcus fascians]MBY4408381.1 AIPR family protein [Rhodococcus fascians]MBY4423495.1 AIPR family protein [Rhodococcus fascians]MBY4461056.1 AIPR family protein [Rhodococcus fascians]
MADNELVLLDQELDNMQNDFGPAMNADRVFEFLACTQVLREHGLSSDEVLAGIVGGGNDGAIDGVYVFLGDALLVEDSDSLLDDFSANKLPVGSTLTLNLVQAKRTPSFTETAIDLVAGSTRRLLDLGQSEEDLGLYYSSALISGVRPFRTALRKFGGRHLKVSIKFFYVTRGNVSSLNSKVKGKSTDLEAQFGEVIVNASGSAQFLGAKQLWERHIAVPSYTLGLTCEEYSTSGNSHIALVPIRDYLVFLRDETGALRRHIFDWNVRDYQGDVEVNREIRNSVLDEGLPEFWWLNNGVTIVCSKASITSKTFWLDDVQVVNGLQTSQTIFHAMVGKPDDHPSMDQKVLVRILKTGDDTKTRDQVIRATNRQTAVPAASLRATDDIQRKIEAFFLANDWYYDRRKNFYRNQGKSPARIVGIPLLAQGIMAMGLSRPDNSRARPSSLLKREVDYKKVFNPDLALEVYLWLAQTLKQVDSFLLTDAAGVNSSERANLRFHLAMLAVGVIHGGRVYDPSQLAPLCSSKLDEGVLKICLTPLREALQKFSVEQDSSFDKAAKGPEFVNYLLDGVLPELVIQYSEA